MRSSRLLSVISLMGLIGLFSACSSTVTVTTGSNSPTVPPTPAPTAITLGLPSASACPTSAKKSNTFAVPAGANVGYCFALTGNWGLAHGFQDSASADQEVFLSTASDPETHIDFIPTKLSLSAAGCGVSVTATCVEKQCQAYITNQLAGSPDVTEGADVVKVGGLNGVGVTIPYTATVVGLSDTQFTAICDATDLGGHFFSTVIVTSAQHNSPAFSEAHTISTSLLFFHA